MLPAPPAQSVIIPPAHALAHAQPAVVPPGPPGDLDDVFGPENRP